MTKWAFLFPGQGSQFEGMGLDFIEHASPAKARYREAEAVLGRSVAELSQPENRDTLAVTKNTQPALYVLSCVIAESLKENGIAPAVVAGHSAGEYAALTCAGVWSFADGLQVIAERARLMHDESAPGAMAAVMGMDAADLEPLCETCKAGVVRVANYNSPKQTVITGEKHAVEALMPILKARGARRVVPLPVGGAFHSPLMRGAQSQFDAFMQTVPMSPPKVPWVSNNTAGSVDQVDEIRRHLVNQFCEPVRWMQSVARLEEYCDAAVEAGPGKVLSGLLKQCSDQLTGVETSTYHQTQKVIQDYGI